MAASTQITTQHLSGLIGSPCGPAIIDVRSNEDYHADPRLIPGSLRRDSEKLARWAPEHEGKQVIVVCRRGEKLSKSTADRLGRRGIHARTLEGGVEGWKEAGEPLVRADKLPPCDDAGRTVWVTRTDAMVDRIACPWLIRRFVNPTAVFLYAPSGEVTAIAERFNATPFDIEGAFWSYRGDNCTFDTMIEEFELRTAPLLQFAEIVRGAESCRPNLTPQSAGFFAASLGYSHIYRNALSQLAAVMGFYDAMYRWCREETIKAPSWPSPASLGSHQI